jgi:hypothetical protein
MIKIVKGAEVDGPRGEAGGKRHGVFAYHADPELYPLVCGFSRQPLLDACRQLKSLYGVTGTGRPGYLVLGRSRRGGHGQGATQWCPEIWKVSSIRVEASGCAATHHPNAEESILGVWRFLIPARS